MRTVGLKRSGSVLLARFLHLHFNLSKHSVRCVRLIGQEGDNKYRCDIQCFEMLLCKAEGREFGLQPFGADHPRRQFRVSNIKPSNVLQSNFSIRSRPSIIYLSNVSVCPCGIQGTVELSDPPSDRLAVHPTLRPTVLQLIRPSAVRSSVRPTVNPYGRVLLFRCSHACTGVDQSVREYQRETPPTRPTN